MVAPKSVVALIQARMDSKRLPGKSLGLLAGKTLIETVISKVKAMSFITEVIVATTKHASDDELAVYLEKLGVRYFRGDIDDVLDRFVNACEDFEQSDCVVRFTADNPLYDSVKSLEAFKSHTESGADYTYIDGLSHIVPEFIQKSALLSMEKSTKDKFDREHVTPFFRKHPESFKLNKLPSTFSNLRPDFDKFLTVDTEEQREFIEQIILDLEKKQKEFDINNVYSWLDDYNLGLKRPAESKTEEGLQVNMSGYIVGDNRPTFIIGEIGQNHNGEIKIAKQLIDMAARCKVNAVKFQKRDIADEFTKEAHQAPYNSPNAFAKTYGAHREFLELSEQEHRELKVYAESKGLVYFCTACDIPSFKMMERIGNPIYKVASRDLTNIPLLQEIAKTGKPVIMSTGMGSEEDIEDALSVFSDKSKVILMQCTSQYPTPIDKINLRAMNTIRNKFGLLTGLSDHNPGIIPGVAASVMGAPIIEKHITLSRSMKGTDQAGALEETGLKKLVDYIRLSEQAMGDGTKNVHPDIEPTMLKLRRSVVSIKDIPKGTAINEDMLGLKCPGTGILWRDRHKLIGKRAKKDIEADSTLTHDQVE